MGSWAAGMSFETYNICNKVLTSLYDYFNFYWNLIYPDQNWLTELDMRFVIIKSYKIGWL